MQLRRLSSADADFQEKFSALVAVDASVDPEITRRAKRGDWRGELCSPTSRPRFFVSFLSCFTHRLRCFHLLYYPVILFRPWIFQ